MGIGKDLEQVTIDSIRLKCYEKTINQIDDYFEYRHDSDKDKKVVLKMLDELSKRIVREVDKLKSQKRQMCLISKGGSYAIESIFELIEAAHKVRSSHFILDGDRIKADSQRYKLFMEKSIECVDCDIVGRYFKKEKFAHDKTYHLNLYAVDSDGHEVLMTKDHIVAKANGGKDYMSNYQTMCTTCNTKKGHK